MALLPSSICPYCLITLFSFVCSTVRLFNSFANLTATVGFIVLSNACFRLLILCSVLANCVCVSINPASNLSISPLALVIPAITLSVSNCSLNMSVNSAIFIYFLILCLISHLLLSVTLFFLSSYLPPIKTQYTSFCPLMPLLLLHHHHTCYKSTYLCIQRIYTPNHL